jgi:hypothetical protein
LHVEWIASNMVFKLSPDIYDIQRFHHTYHIYLHKKVPRPNALQPLQFEPAQAFPFFKQHKWWFLMFRNDVFSLWSLWWQCTENNCHIHTCSMGQPWLCTSVGTIAHTHKVWNINLRNVLLGVQEVLGRTEVEVNLPSTVSRPVCLGVRRPSGTCDRFFFLLKISLRQLRVCYFVAPSLTRGRVCNLLYNCFWASPENSLLGRSPAEFTTIFYCLIWDSPNLEGQVPVFISPRNRVAQLYPRALGSG